MRVKRVLIVVSILLVGILLVKINQTSQLKKQHQTLEAEYNNAQSRHESIHKIVSQPTVQKINLKASKVRVKQFIDIVQNNKASDYQNKLKDFTTLSVINQLTNTLAPSVQNSTLAHYDVPVVAVNKQWEDKAQFLVVAKKDVQSVAWQVTYDLHNQKVTAVSRLPLKGAFDNER
ncbi:hypothetical protein [Leuconostoc citreum]|uniref:hypothetical protein n=1 Tax=Leuconostoc citreum TaxID=33964 RepID=UPI0031345EA5